MPDTIPPLTKESRRPILPSRPHRPPALTSEDLFGKVFDGNVVRRFFGFL